MHRREWLKQVGQGSALASVSTALQAQPLLAGTVLQAVPDGLSVFEHSVEQLLDGAVASTDERVQIHLKPIAANSAVVPVEVVVKHKETQQICILIDNHNTALVAQLDTLHPSMLPRLSAHLQLIRPARVVALVQTSDGWLRQSQAIVELRSRCEPDSVTADKP